MTSWTINAAKTHCVNGHPLSGDNVRHPAWAPHTRMCLACKKARNRRHYGLPETGPDMRIKHGHGRRSSQTRIWRAWKSMLQRCEAPNNRGYSRYGGRGISVCERWHDFSNFLADMGERPEGLTLDRINNDGNYEPGNCRWATIKEQSRNKSTNRFIEFNGERRCLTEWAEVLGIKTGTLQARLKKWPIEQALTP